MTWLVAHDIVPAWTAEPPPRLRPADWLGQDGWQAGGGQLRSQFSIHDDTGQLGSVWTEYIVDENSILRTDLIGIRRLPSPVNGGSSMGGALSEVAPLRITADSVYTADGTLDEFSMRLENRNTDVRLHGERFHSAFSFTLESGPMERAFKIPLTEGGLISGAFTPFAALSDLRVGQRWRMQVFNPIAAVTGMGNRFIPMLVEVTGEERIATPSGDRNCLVVESPNAKAWVDAYGAVLVQEMTLPLVGRIRIVREMGFDEEARGRVRGTILPRGGRRP